MATIYAPESALRVQYGRESTAGTAVAATEIWQGGFSNIKDDRTRERYEGAGSGTLAPRSRNIDTGLMAHWTMPASPLTFEQVLFILESGIKTVSPTGVGPYVYTGYDLPVATTLNAIKTYTIETYNAMVDDDFSEMEYAVCQEFELTCSAGGMWEMSGTWFGRQVTAGGSPTSLSTFLSVQEAVANRTKLYIDATGGTIGSTQKTGVFMGATITVNTGWQPIPVGDGNLYFAGVKMTQPTVTFSIQLELEETSDVSLVAVERAIADTDAFRLFRLELDGEDANHEMIIDFAGKYDINGIGDYTTSDGNVSVELTGYAEYSTTDTLFFEAAVTNDLASL